MNERTNDSSKQRIVLAFALAISAPLFMTQCRSVGGTYQDIEYDPMTLKTPDGHGMKKEDYPFDDAGNYRKDWVKNKEQGRTRSSYGMPDPEPAVVSEAAEAARVSGSIAPTSSPLAARQPVNSITSASYSEVGGSSASAGYSTPNTLTAAALDSSSYHRVKSGETLYSISRRYNTSISELKRVNGLTNDTIRSGQSLRLP